MKKLCLVLVCLSLAAVMILSACENSDRAPVESSLTTTTTVADDTPKDTGIYNIATDFTKKCASKNATIAEVEELIVLAKEVYSKYDTVIVNKDITIETVDIPSLTVDTVAKLNSGDQKIKDYKRYLSESALIFFEMLSEYLPEENVLIMKGETSSGMIPDYYFLNIEEKGIKNAEEAYDKIFDDGTADFDKVADCIYLSRRTVFFYDAETDERIPIFYTPDENAIIEAMP